jgi:hypothetical protein
MRVGGIRLETEGFDFLGRYEEQVVLDTSVQVVQVAPEMLCEE